MKLPPTSMLEKITPLILTLDEAPNIGRALDRLRWAKDIVVVDSFSQDQTCEIVRRHPNARLFQRRFDLHSRQWQFGLEETGIATEWVLALDADYIVTDALVRELDSLAPGANVTGYRAAFTYCVGARPLRNTVYPPVTVLYRRANARYVQDGHTQRVRLAGGEVADLEFRILHDDRKSLGRWLRSQDRYMRLEAAKLAGMPYSTLRLQDKVRRLVLIAPMAMLFYCLFAKGNILDGRAGMAYALQRAIAEGILSFHLLRALIGHQRSMT